MKIGQFKKNKKKYLLVVYNGQVYQNNSRLSPNTVDLVRNLGKKNLTSKILELIKNSKFKKILNKEELIYKKYKPLKPIDITEAWAVGVTYRRQALEHDKDLRLKGKKDDLYFYVYKNHRAEVFFKGVSRTIVGSNEKLYLRSDSKLIMPEPELVLIIGNNGLPVGYTLGNDLTAWDIEKECPLYLSQAKVWEGSGSFGPWIIPTETVSTPYDFEIKCKVIRKKKIILESTGNTKDLKRSVEELCYFMNLSNKVSPGSVLFTGTACVIDHNFSLKKNDLVSISNSQIGNLENYIDLHKKDKKYYNRIKF